MVLCPECLRNAPNANAEVHIEAMDIHTQLSHGSTYQMYYGVVCPPQIICFRNGCRSSLAISQPGHAPDHLLTHGIEDLQTPSKLTRVNTLTRLSITNINIKLLGHAHAQNILKDRIEQAEAQLQFEQASVSGYHSVHGLDVTKRWSESGAVDKDEDAAAGIARVKANPLTGCKGHSFVKQYLAAQLLDVRLEAAEKGMLLDGVTQGSYLQVAQDLELQVATLGANQGYNQ